MGSGRQGEVTEAASAIRQAGGSDRGSQCNQAGHEKWQRQPVRSGRPSEVAEMAVHARARAWRTIPKIKILLGLSRLLKSKSLTDFYESKSPLSPGAAGAP